MVPTSPRCTFCTNVRTGPPTHDRVFVREQFAQHDPLSRGSVFDAVPDMMPKLRVDRGAIKFVFSGANIMCPGLTSAGATIHDEAEIDTPVVRPSLRHPLPRRRAPCTFDVCSHSLGIAMFCETCKSAVRHVQLGWCSRRFMRRGRTWLLLLASARCQQRTCMLPTLSVRGSVTVCAS